MPQSDGSILLRWDDLSGHRRGKDYYYDVERGRDVLNARLHLIASGIFDADGDGTVEYLDDDSALQPGLDYLYSVRFLHDGIRLGGLSAPISVTVDPRSSGASGAVGTSRRGRRQAPPPPASPSYSTAGIDMTVAANTPDGAAIGSRLAATPGTSQGTLTYTLTCDHKNHFTIDSASGQLRVKGKLDYRSRRTYALIVTATDDRGRSTQMGVDVTLTNVYGPPANVLAAPQSDGSVLLTWDDITGAAANTFYLVKRGLASDRGNLPVIAHWVVDKNEDGTVEYRDAASALQGGQTYVYQVALYTDSGQLLGRWSPRVTATVDGASAGATGADGAQEAQQREPGPYYTAASIALNVAENTPVGTGISRSLLTATPESTGDTLTYSLGGTDQDYFRIDSATSLLRINSALDYTPGRSYSLTVTATDGDGLSDSMDVTITVTDVYGPPANVRPVAQPDGTVLLSWDAVAGAWADTFYKVKRGSETPGSLRPIIARRVVDDNGGGTVEYRDADSALQTGQTYAYAVAFFNGAGQRLGTYSSPVSVWLGPNEAPAFAAATATRSVAANTAAGTGIGDPVMAADPDDGDSLTYRLGGRDQDHFAIDSASGQLQTKGALDYEGKSSYAVTVTATDRSGLTASIAVTITVTDVADTLPGQPAAPAISEVAQTSFRATWTAPAAGSSPITGYGIQ